MDITKVGQEAESDDTLIEVPIVDRRGNPYRGKNGEQTVLLIVGEYSKAYRKNERILSARLFSGKVQRPTDAAEDYEVRMIESASCGVVGWKNAEDASGEPAKYSLDGVIVLLTEAPWIMKQVQKAVREHGSFFAARSAS